MFHIKNLLILALLTVTLFLVNPVFSQPAPPPDNVYGTDTSGKYVFLGKGYGNGASGDVGTGWYGTPDGPLYFGPICINNCSNAPGGIDRDRGGGPGACNSSPPSCGGSCSGCRREATCDESTCNRSGCDCTWRRIGPDESEFVRATGTYCADSCQGRNKSDCQSAGGCSWGGESTGSCASTCSGFAGSAGCYDSCGNYICCTLPPPPITNTPTPTPTPTSTPTPTPTPILSWKKLKDASLQRSGVFSNPIPNVPVPYDSDDTPPDSYLIRDEGGVVAVDTLSINTSNPSAQASSSNWQVTGYTPNIVVSKDNFLSYVRSRKSYKEINSSLAADITADGIYLWSGSLPLSVSSLPDYNFVLIVNGEIDITGNITPAKSAALLADSIVVKNTVTQINAILVAGSVDTGTANDVGLKIKGNLVTTTLTNGRNQNATNNKKPSVFIVVDPMQYISLLPYLSVDAYVWKQLQ